MAQEPYQPIKPHGNPWFSLIADLDKLDDGLARAAQHAILNGRITDPAVGNAVKAMRSALGAYDLIMRQAEIRRQEVDRLEAERRGVA